jgi:hypothetical protein
VNSTFRRYWQLATDKIFLNHGSFGACPTKILNLQTELRRQMEAEPVQFLWRRFEERLEPARQELARFVGANSQDLAFVTNATAGVNAVLRSLRLRRGDELLTTNHDYNACHNVLVEVARMTGAKLVVANVPFPLRAGSEITAAILRAVTRRTRLAMIDHVTSNTALVFPLRQIIRELDARGVDTLVDGAHAPGMLPLNLRALRPAYYTANLHKWVCFSSGEASLPVNFPNSFFALSTIHAMAASMALSTAPRIFAMTSLILSVTLPSPIKPARKLIASDSRLAKMRSTRLAAAVMLPPAMATIESMKPVTTWMIFEIFSTNTMMVS